MESDDYFDIINALNQCEPGSNEEFQLYKKLVKLVESDKWINDLNEIFHENTDESGNPVLIIDEYAGPMDNLAYMYMERNEYDKALPLLEKTLPLYRVLEITKPNYSYQRYYATERLIKCLYKLGHEILAVYYEYELLYLKSTLPKLHKEEIIEDNENINQTMDDWESE